MLLASNPLIQVTPGLMIWTIVCFLIALFVLKRYAFGPIQKMIDTRREQIRRSLEEADHAREEARRLLEEHRKLIGQARSEAEQILAEARRTGEAMEHRMREETETERQRRIEETRREIAAEPARALEKIRAGELEEIAREFERLMAREERRLDVELITARELTDDEAEAIVKQIEKAAGRKVDATRSVDPELVGGIVLNAGSYRADASVRGRLER